MSDITSSKYFCSCGKTTLLDGSQSCLCNEIERLRESEGRLRESIDKWRVKAESELGEIHKLMERIAELETELAVWDGREAVLCTRIDELEKLLGAITKTASDTRIHHITDAQIDAAWEAATNPCRTREESEGALTALKELGIERCVGCHGTNRPEYPLEGNYGDCPDCDGHGWLIGGEDE